MSSIIKISSLLVTVALLSVGCGGGSGPTTPKSDSANRAWMNDLHADSNTVYYGQGDGDSIDVAKNNALASIAARISVSVDSEISKNSTLKRSNGSASFSEEVKNNVKAKAEKIAFTDVKITEKFRADNGRWNVLVEVDRTRLFRTYEGKAKDIDTKIKAEWKEYTKASPFGKLMFSAKIEKLQQEALALFPIISAINSQYNADALKANYVTQSNDMRAQKGKLRIRVVSDKISSPLAKLIRAKLSENEVKLSSKAFNVTISVKTTAKKKKYRSSNAKMAQMTFALRTAVIKAVDNKNNVIANRAVKTKAGSSLGYNDALTQVKQYEKLIKKQGILGFLTSSK